MTTTINVMDILRDRRKSESIKLTNSVVGSEEYKKIDTRLKLLDDLMVEFVNLKRLSR